MVVREGFYLIQIYINTMVRRFGSMGPGVSMPLFYKPCGPTVFIFPNSSANYTI